MKTAFDHIAQSYDQSFTYTAVGMAQRKLVCNYFEKIISNQSGLNILELNCGTGEDAVWLAQKGHNVMATDISGLMLNQVEIKAIQHNLTDKLKFQVVDIQLIDKIFIEEKFDLVFSNFGGFNCLSQEDLCLFFQSTLPKLLKANGKFIGVIMPKFCCWESVYFLVKLEFSKVFRRFSKKPLEASLGSGVSIKTWYFSPKNVQESLPKNLTITHKQPIGFFIPPSYLNSIFEKRKLVLKFLEKLENWAIKIPFLAKASDHFLIEIVKKNK